MTNEIKFADTVILVDVAYVDRVAGDLSKHLWGTERNVY